VSKKGAESAQTAPGSSAETDESRYDLSKCREEFSGLKKTSRKRFGDHRRIFNPGDHTARGLGREWTKKARQIQI